MSGSIITDVFRQDAFTSITLTTAVEKVPFKPGLLGSLGIFTPMAPLYTKDIMVESRDGQLVIIPASQRGGPVAQRMTEKRKAVPFEAPRLAFGDTIYAHELQFVRQFGEAAFMQVQQEVARRMAGPTGLTTSLELTWERMRLGCIQGRVLDADNSVIFDFFDAFGVTEPDEIDFDLDNANPAQGALQKVCNQTNRTILRAAKAPDGVGRVVALCGDDFWDLLITHKEVEQTYLNQIAAAQLREREPFQRLEFGGITWINYRGTDDNSATTGVAIAASKARFFPTGVPGLFEEGWAPSEFLPDVGQAGRPRTVRVEFDKGEPPAWWKQEVFSYPVYICTRPECLQRGKMT